MAVYQYKGMNIIIPDFDLEHKGYFEAAHQHKLVMKRCLDCGLLRWEPGAGCPWCTSLKWDWHQVSGKGTIYSYQIVTHAIIPGFQDWTPYPTILVELDEQRGIPSVDEGLRLVANLVDNNFRPEREEKVAIGHRVEVTFMTVSPEFTLPQFKLSGEPPQGPVWQFQQR